MEQQLKKMHLRNQLSRPKLTGSGRKTAFSLVEVAISLGILTFAMIPILALVPLALNTNRQSIEMGMEARILGSTRAELNQVPSSQLDSLPSLFFNPEGDRIDPGQLSVQEARYRVDFEFFASTELPHAQASSRLRTLRYEIHNLVRNEASAGSLHISDNGH